MLGLRLFACLVLAFSRVDRGWGPWRGPPGVCGVGGLEREIKGTQLADQVPSAWSTQVQVSWLSTGWQQLAAGSSGVGAELQTAGRASQACCSPQGPAQQLLVGLYQECPVFPDVFQTPERRWAASQCCDQ